MSLKALVTIVTVTAVAISTASLLYIPIYPQLGGMPGLFFWVGITALSAAFPVKMPGGALVDVTIAPIIASAVLGGPTAALVVSVVGTIDGRELRGLLGRPGGVPWYGTVYNHSALAIPAVIAGFWLIGAIGATFAPNVVGLLAVVFAGVVYFVINNVLAAAAIAVRGGRHLNAVLSANIRQFGISLVGLTPMSWLMATMWTVAGPLGVIPFGIPLLVTRVGFKKIVEIRDMFTQTVRSLAGAVDAKDPFTAGHSERVQLIAKDLGEELRCSDSELEALEWGGLLHDIGKIGIPDAILLKQGALTRDERMVMNSHPVKGEEIIRPVEKLKPELPIIRHHHEWFNGSGYPDRLVGHQIPKLARILHVADSFEAMTAARPYRMTPLTEKQALAELDKFSGIQFDPEVVEAFKRLIARRPEWAKPNIPPELEQLHKQIPRLGERPGVVPA